MPITCDLYIMDIHKIKYLLYIAKKGRRRIEKGHKGIEKERRKIGRKEGTRINLSLTII